MFLFIILRFNHGFYLAFLGVLQYNSKPSMMNQAKNVNSSSVTIYILAWNSSGEKPTSSTSPAHITNTQIRTALFSRFDDHPLQNAAHIFGRL